MAACFALILLIGVEVSFRMQGHRPSVRDSPRLWSFHRERVEPDQVVLLGASRMQLGFSLKAFRKRYPQIRVTMLAAAATSPAGAFKQICNDESFHGLVICSIPDMNTLDKEQTQQMAAHVGFADTAPFYSPVETMLECAMASTFVVTRQNLGLKRTLTSLAMQSRLPTPHHVTTRFDRTSDADFEIIDEDSMERLRKRYLPSNLGTYTEEDRLKWMETLESIKQNVDKLQARGGRILFVAMPVGERKYENTEVRFPRAVFWDELEKQTNASTMHFKDVTGLTSFYLPDRSHIDSRDKDRFTWLFLDRVEAMGLLPIPHHALP